MDLAKHTRYWRCSSTAYITTNRPSSCDQMIVACLLLLEKHMRNWKRYRMLWNATTRHVVLVILKGQHFLNLQSNASDTSDFSLSIASWLPFCVVWTNKLLICTEQYVMADTWLFYWLFINMHGTVNTVQKVSVCGQTIKSMIDGVRTETHEIIESCCVFLQSKLAQVQQTSCFYLKVAWTITQKCPKELHFTWWLCSPWCPQFWNVLPLRARFILGNRKSWLLQR